MDRIVRPTAPATLAIIAGGRAERLRGVPKGLLRVGGRTVIERLQSLAPLFEEVLLVANEPGPYARFGLRVIPDAVPGRGAPGGVHAALLSAQTPWVVAVACDMPFVGEAVVGRLLEELTEEVDAVCFEAGGRPEPLLAAYRKALAPAWGSALEEQPSLRALLGRFRTRVLPEEELRRVDPTLQAVRSVNTEPEARSLGVELPGGF